MVATPQTFVATTIGRVAIPKLADTLVRTGADKFVKVYGQKAFEAILGTAIGVKAYSKTEEYITEYLNHIDTGGDENSFVPKGSMPTATRAEQMDAMMAVPDTTHKSVTDTPSGLVIGGEKKEPLPPPEPFTTPADPQEPITLSTPEAEKQDTTLITPEPKKIDTTLSTPIPKESGPIIYTKDDVSKQTKKLVPEKVELGPLTKVEKETALALKEDKPDFYSRIIKAIEESEQTKMSYEQWGAIAKKAGSKEELDYLGLEKLAALRQAKGTDIISKEDLLYDIRFYPSKDIASNIMVTTIPEEDMVSDFDEYRLGYENPGSRKMNVYQIDLPPETSEDAEFNLGKKIFQASPAHVKEKYGRNQFLHTATQVGLGDPDAPPADLGDEAKEIAEKLQNTLIIDEIQSDWIQSIQKEGSAKEWTLIKGSDVTKEFINKNFGDKYELKISKYATLKQTLEKTGLAHNKVLYVKTLIEANEEGLIEPAYFTKHVLTNIDNDKYYTFDKGRIRVTTGFDTEQLAEDYIASEAVADFPIKHSKKWVEFALNNEIKNAVLNGQDSIAITNGNIQQSRSKEEGTKKFYNEIVLGQLKKIATKYGAKVEEISFEPDKYLRLQENLKKLKEKGFEETTVTREVLVKYITNKWNKDDPTSPAHAVRRFRGRNTPSDWVVNLPDFREIILGDDSTPYTNERFDEMVRALPLETKLLLFKNRETGEINFEYPVIQQSKVGEEGLLHESYMEFLESSQQYSDTLGHGVIKMELPKKLQKEILKEPIKFSKAKQQTERLFA